MKWPEYNAIIDMKNPIFCVGILFSDKELKDITMNANTKDRINILLKKNGILYKVSNIIM